MRRRQLLSEFVLLRHYNLRLCSSHCRFQNSTDVQRSLAKLGVVLLAHVQQCIHECAAAYTCMHCTVGVFATSTAASTRAFWQYLLSWHTSVLAVIVITMTAMQHQKGASRIMPYLGQHHHQLAAIAACKLLLLTCDQLCWPIRSCCMRHPAFSVTPAVALQTILCCSCCC
jgi:hypothetical protein